MRKVSSEVAVTVVRECKVHVTKGKVFPVHVMKKYGGGGRGRFQSLLTSAVHKD
jgi:hypothetical protein